MYVKDFHSFRDRPVSFVIYKLHLQTSLDICVGFNNLRLSARGVLEELNGATLKAGIRNPETGIRNPESGIRNPESGIRNPELRMMTEKFTLTMSNK